ncbi:hypothetical protein ABES03_25360, partial [Neobacillus rhizosphaerae]|uniref:hypothetical protein n=1 Tax=Neobacillus rhizosphaerae TaxID=2880965 RepID=UPI003D2A93AF
GTVPFFIFFMYGRGFLRNHKKMELSIFISLTIFLLLSFIVKKQKLTLFENIFLYIIVEFMVTSYCAILYINVDVWHVANKAGLFIIFRIYEAIVYPAIWLWYFNLHPQRVAKLSRLLLAFLFVGIECVVEKALVLLGVIIYKDWQVWQSVLVQILVLVMTSVLLTWFQTILKKEGIH